MTDTAQQWWYVFDEQTRILVVDDDPILREFASVYLTTPMSEVVLAPDAATALDILSREIFDIAIIDIEMPAVDRNLGITASGHEQRINLFRLLLSQLEFKRARRIGRRAARGPSSPRARRRHRASSPASARSPARA